MKPACSLILAAAAFSLAAGSAAQTIDGAQTYRAACAACHGADGRGRSSAELGFDDALPDFTDCDFGAREPNADWSAIVHRGGPVRAFSRRMPAFEAALTHAEIEAAVDYLRHFCSDDRWPRGELNLPRAFFTEKAFPEDEAVISTTLQTEGLDSLSHELIWEQRFGPLNQIEISVPLTRADLGDPQGWKGGTGDLAVGVKHTLHQNLAHGSILSVGGELVLPTGDETKGFGAGSTILETSLMYGKILPRDSFVQLQGIAEFPSDASLEDEIAVRTAIGRTWTADAPFGRAWTPMLEALGARELESGADLEWDLVPQVQITLSTRQHVVASVGARVPVTRRSERETQIVLYLLWDWFDGGVREGW
jgi:mono/diheme cytochrome c family protein